MVQAGWYNHQYIRQVLALRSLDQSLECNCTVGWHKRCLRPLSNYAQRLVSELGSKAVSFQQLLFQHETFIQFVEFTWAEIQVDGWNIFGFKEKLNELKAKLKVWNVEVFCHLDNKILILVRKLNDSDAKASILTLSEEKWILRRQIT